MSWLQHHRVSETHADRADLLMRQGDRTAAAREYLAAAEAEHESLQALDPADLRSYGIIAVSTVALYCQAAQFDSALAIAHTCLAIPDLSAFAKTELQDLVQTMWDEAEQEQAGIRLSSKQLDFTLGGDSILRGAAPMELVSANTHRAESFMYRVAEFWAERPFRQQGKPPREIVNTYPLWLVQSAPGSFRFGLAVGSAAEPQLFSTAQSAQDGIVDTALAIIEAGSNDPRAALPEVVGDPRYRLAFLKLLRDFSPTGRRIERLEIGESSSERSVSLTRWTRQNLNAAIREMTAASESADHEEMITLRGVLRALSLERDWIEVLTDDEPSPVKVSGADESIDDRIGPMVNQDVIVTAVKTARGALRFRDIEPAD